MNLIGWILLVLADDWCVRQHVRVRSYVRVWKSWIRLVECDLELTINHGGNPEKHSLRIVRLALSNQLVVPLHSQ